MPQLAQNFAPGESGVSQFAHFFGSSEVPQPEQNLAPGCAGVWQLGQEEAAAAAACCTFAPQLAQNFAPEGFGVPHFGQGVPGAGAGRASPEELEELEKSGDDALRRALRALFDLGGGGRRD